jgi:hypothetical protein
MQGEGGQATVEWAGILLILSLALGGLAAIAPPVDGRSYGGFLAHRVFCAVRGGCNDGDAALADAYGERDAALVRAHAPNLVYEPGERQLPVDYRRCRRTGCADAPDDRDLDAHRTLSGERATVFTRVIRREGRTYIQYWLYYPDSKTVVLGSDKAWEAAWLLPRLAGIVKDAPTYPGLHRDDWEGNKPMSAQRGPGYLRHPLLPRCEPQGLATPGEPPPVIESAGRSSAAQRCALSKTSWPSRFPPLGPAQRHCRALVPLRHRLGSSLAPVCLVPRL